MPSTPPSFVKFKASVSAVITGASVSTPISDQVPLLKYAKLRSSAGTAATADPVSCPATAITGIAPNPVIFCTSSVNVPIFSPGKTKRPKFSSCSPTAFSNSGSRRCVCAFTNWAVEAMVYSVTIFPVSI